jgi:hypothetical protein
MKRGMILKPNSHYWVLFYVLNSVTIRAISNSNKIINIGDFSVNNMNDLTIYFAPTNTYTNIFVEEDDE